MTITLVGFVVIPIGLILFILGKRPLLYAYVFSIPFSATAIVNFSSITFGVQPSFYFMGLLIVRQVMSISLKSKVIILDTPEAKWGFVFLLVAALSLIMPVIIDDTIWVRGPGLLYQDVRLTSKNLTQFLYFLFSFLAFLTVAAVAKDEQVLLKSIRVHLFAGAFVSLWGIYQLSSRLFEFPYLEIFNNSVSVSLGHFEMAGFAPKLSSTTPEGSAFAHYLASVFPIVTIFILSPNVRVISRRSLRALWLLIFGATLLNLATTTYMTLGLFVIAILLFGVFPSIKGKLTHWRPRRLRLLLMMIVMFVAAQMVWQMLTGLDLLTWAFGTTYEKFTLKEWSSGWYRWQYFIEAFDLFLRYPMLGLGIGSVGATGLFGTLLGSVGIMGTLPFLLFVLSILRGGRRAIKLDESSSLSLIGHAVFIAYLCVIITMMAVAGAPFFQHSWFLAGIISAASSLAKSREDSGISRGLPKQSSEVLIRHHSVPIKAGEER